MIETVHAGGRRRAVTTPSRVLLMALVTTALIFAGCTAAAPVEEPETLGVTRQALYAPPECNTTCQTNGTLSGMNAAATKYGFPRWFIYATARRESSFNKDAENGSGSGNCDIGYGLTQLTCASHDGIVYPEDLPSQQQSNSAWQGDMRISAFCTETGLCPWIDMANVSALNNTTERRDAAKNLDRYFSGYAAPAYYLERTRAPQLQGESTYDFRNRILRRVAWHWRYGHYTYLTGSCYCGTCGFSYPTDPCNYFTGPDQYRWDNYVSTYRPNVEADDGVWNGNVCTPPYSSNGCGSPSAPQYTSSATATPTCRLADGGTVAIAATYTNTNNTAYESMLDIEVWSGATKIDHGYTQRTFGAGARRTSRGTGPCRRASRRRRRATR